MPAQQQMAQPAPQAIDVTLSNFAKEVIDASHESLMILDFWAPWCGPCKQFGPLLDKAVADTAGAARLAKVNIDTCPQIAQQLHIQSIPAVFAFYKGQPVDGFLGAQPEPQIKQWLNALIKATGAKAPDGLEDFTKALEQAEAFLQENNLAMAQAIYADIHAQQPDNVAALAGLLRCMIAQGQVDEAAAVLAQTPDALTQDKAMQPVHAALAIALHAAKANGCSSGELEKRLEVNPDDHQARYDLALQAYANGQAEQAIDLLLDLFARNRTWNEDAARKQLVEIFEALGHTHPLTIGGRKKLSSLLFA